MTNSPHSMNNHKNTNFSSLSNFLKYTIDELKPNSIKPFGGRKLLLQIIPDTKISNIIKTMLKFSLLTSFLMASFAFAMPIKKIDILGLNAISRGTILSYLPVEVGDDYSKDTSAKIIQTLYKTQFFKDIKVTESQQILKITITENPHIKYVDLLNYSNKVIDDDAIKKVLSSMNLTQGKIFNKRQLSKLIKQLKATYIAKGYYNIKITKNVEVDKRNRVGVELDISEGDVARIKSMNIIGNKVQKTQDLFDFFKIGEPDWPILNYFTEKDHYSKISLDAGIEALKSHYINLGYLDIQASFKTELSSDKKNINIVIHIDEGSEYKVGKIEFAGDALNQSDESLSKLLVFKTGDIFKRKEIIESVKAITYLFTNQGYAFVRIDPLTTENTEQHIIDLKFHIKPNKKIYINRIEIVGNTRTQDEVVRREISIYEGELYSDRKLQESLTKIKQLGFFSDVQMNVSKPQGFEDKINLNFSVEETKTGTFSVGLSHSNNTGSSFTFGIQEKNFLGTGNILNASLSSSKAVKEINFYFLDPYFTQDGHSISYGIFYKETGGKALNVASYKINTKGGSVGYSIPISKNTSIITDLRISSRKISCGTTFSIAEPAQCDNKNKTEVKLSAGWNKDTLDDYNFPTKGNYNSLNLGVALPISDFKYYKLNAISKKFYPLSKNLTTKISANLGVAKGYGNKELPFFERYYGGGSSSVRGFAFNSLGKKYTIAGLTDIAKGGELSILANASIISPLLFIKNSKNMRISTFIDVGGISEKASINKDDLRASVGVAFTWLTPIGPLGAYIAKPLLKKPGDKTKTFELTIGTSF